MIERIHALEAVRPWLEFNLEVNSKMPYQKAFEDLCKTVNRLGINDKPSPAHTLITIVEEDGIVEIDSVVSSNERFLVQITIDQAGLHINDDPAAIKVYPKIHPDDIVTIIYNQSCRQVTAR